MVTIDVFIDLYGSDAIRIALAEAGDNLDDANLTHENAKKAILRLSTLENFIRETTQEMNCYRRNAPSKLAAFFDRVFENELANIFIRTLECYEKMQFREVLKMCFFEFVSSKDSYKINISSVGPREDLIYKYIYYQLLLIYPIAPHMSDFLYRNFFYPLIGCKDSSYPRFISLARYPKV